jgi:hypothetical protein
MELEVIMFGKVSQSHKEKKLMISPIYESQSKTKQIPKSPGSGVEGGGRMGEYERAVEG